MATQDSSSERSSGRVETRWRCGLCGSGGRGRVGRCKQRVEAAGKSGFGGLGS